MATFIGLRAVRLKENFQDGEAGQWTKATVQHFNVEYIKRVDEKKMQIEMNDAAIYRIDEESLQIFLAAAYGENSLRGDKLEEE